MQVNIVYIQTGIITKGMAKYSWPPCTNKFKSAAFDIKKIIYLLTQQATLMRSPLTPLYLGFPFS